MEATGARLAMLRNKLHGLQQALRLVHRAPDGRVVDRDVLDHALQARARQAARRVRERRCTGGRHARSASPRNGKATAGRRHLGVDEEQAPERDPGVLQKHAIPRCQLLRGSARSRLLCCRSACLLVGMKSAMRSGGAGHGRAQGACAGRRHAEERALTLVTSARMGMSMWPSPPLLRGVRIHARCTCSNPALREAHRRPVVSVIGTPIMVPGSGNACACSAHAPSMPRSIQWPPSTRSALTQS